MAPPYYTEAPYMEGYSTKDASGSKIVVCFSYYMITRPSYTSQARRGMLVDGVRANSRETRWYSIRILLAS